MPIVTRGGPKGIEEADYYEVPDQVNVAEWSPDPVPGRSPATQVHLLFGKPPGNVFVVRLKSPRTLSVLIHALKEHRDNVWPTICGQCDGTGVHGMPLAPTGTQTWELTQRCARCNGKGTL